MVAQFEFRFTADITTAAEILDHSGHTVDWFLALLRVTRLAVFGWKNDIPVQR